MNKKIKYSIFFLIIILLMICVLGWMNFFFNKTRNAEKGNETSIEKIAISSILLQGNDEKTIYTEKNMVFEKKSFEYYVDIINSVEIRDKIESIYPDCNPVELELIDNSHMIKLIYVCDEYSEDECIAILKEYMSVFREYMSSTYNIETTIADSATISTRYVE